MCEDESNPLRLKSFPMLLRQLQRSDDRVSKLVPVSTFSRLLTGLQCLTVAGLISYFSFRSQMSLGASNALLAVLILAELISLVMARWMADPEQLASEAHQQVEAALRQSEAKFRRLVDSNLIGVYVANFSGTIFESNDAFLEMVGYSQADLQAGRLNWVEMTPPQYSQLDQQALAEQQATGACRPFEKEYYRQDGSCVPVLFGCAVFDPDQQRSIGFVLDLSARKQAEAALQLNEAKFRRLIEADLIGVSIANCEGAIFEANNAFLNMLGYTRDDLHAGQVNWLKMTPPEYLEIDRQATENLRRTGIFTAFEKEYWRKDGSRVPVLIGHAVFDEAQEISIGFVLDLSDRKQAEVASVLEERNRIAREIHDTLAQAFTSLMVHLEVAAYKLESDPATVRQCIETSYDLARSGLAEARRSVAALRPHYLEDDDLYHALCHLGAQIFTHSPTQMVYNCQGERYPIRQEIEHHLLRIGQEALINASKYAKATKVEIDLQYEPDQCVLRIKDNGVGFAVGTAPPNHHFGLRGMVERADQIGATLTIQTAIGQGTDVTVVAKRRLHEST
jgi:PAS domain S-box-containing protein